MKMLKTGDNVTMAGSVKQRNEVKESWEDLSSAEEEEEEEVGQKGFNCHDILIAIVIRTISIVSLS